VARLTELGSMVIVAETDVSAKSVAMAAMLVPNMFDLNGKRREICFEWDDCQKWAIQSYREPDDARSWDGPLRKRIL
jgi:hypothetical protein